jgi:hypothetical protein
MNHPDPQERLGTAAAAVKQASRLLTAPNAGALEECRRQLDSALEMLRPLANDSSLADPAVRTKLHRGAAALRTSLTGTWSLFDHAAGFYAGWTRLRHSMTGGYTAAGEPAEVTASGRLSVEG